MGRGRSRPARDPQHPRRRQDRRHQLRLAARDVEPARQHACGARRRARRSRRDAAAADAGGGGRAHRDLQARRGRGAARDPVRRRCAELPPAERGREGRHHQRAGAREAQPDPRRAAGAVRALDRRARRRRARPLRDDRARVRRFHAGRHHARRSRADDLHLRHHRPGEGRAARASRAARPSARRGDAARVFPATGRPVLDAGRLGLGRRPARLPAAEPASRRAGGGAQVREIRSRGGLRAAGEGAGAQRLHPADRAAHAALRALAEGPPRHRACARSARAASRSAPRPTSGAATPSGSPSTSSTARPNAISCSPPAR